MAVVVGSARQDERKKLKGGKAGDQLQVSTPDYKGEVGFENFYVHKLGWVVLRAKDANIARKIALAMWTACNNKNVGYDQNQRLGVITYGTNSSVPTECDCSSLVRQCVREASGVDAGNFTTANEATKLMATGLFNKLAYTSKSALREGDILVTKTSGHTVVVVSIDNTTPVTNSVDVYYRVYANGKWYAEVKNTNDYAGVENAPISAIMAKTSAGKISVNVAPIGKNYLGWASGYDANDYNNGYAGSYGKDIDRVQMKLEGVSGKNVKYRVSVVGSTAYLPWVTGLNDYAGIKGKKIDKVQIVIE